MANFSLSQRSENNMQGVNPLLIQLARRAIKLTKIDFGIPTTGGKRDAETQHGLYLTVNNEKGPDGYEIVGKHQKGEALDYYGYVEGKASWKKEHLSQIAAAFLQAAIDMNIKIHWGGLFSNWTDMPHVELVD